MSANIPPSWENAKRLLLEAIALPEKDRRAFLAKICGGDETLYAEIESLLAHHEEAEQVGFLEAHTSNSAVGTEGNTDASSRSEFTSEDQGDFERRHGFLATATSAAQIGELWNSRYEVVKEVGRGAMGLVYRGRHRKLGMDVAIKVLKQGASEDRFLREAKALAQIRSPYVVRVHDFEILPGGVPILVMEWVDGEDLRKKMLSWGGRISERCALPWMRDVCKGMEAAEAEGLIHRDLKPSNILIDARNQARVADFGLVRSPTKTDELSLTSNAMGTPLYMAPEQAEDPRGVDTRADIYSVGATFYHLLTGTPPFSGETPFSILFKHKTEPLISPKARFPAISERTSQVLERCLAKSPAERFQSFGSLLRQLEASATEFSPWNSTGDQDFAEYLSRYRERRSTYFEFPRPDGQSDVYEFPDGRAIRIIVGNLVAQDVDAIVSSDVAYLPMNDGVAGAIREAAGEQVAVEARRFAPVRPGRAIATSGGNLPAKFVFHGVTMGVRGDRYLLPSRDIISEILSSCFYHADTLSVSRIAFPLLGTGAGGFPADICLDVLFRFLCRTFGRGMTCVREARIILLPGNAQQPKEASSRGATEPEGETPRINGYSFFQHTESVSRASVSYSDYITLRDGRLAAVIANPPGHNRDNLIMMGWINVELRRRLELEANAAVVMADLNSWLCRKNPQMFLPMIIAVLDSNLHELTVVNAGHAGPIFRHSDGRTVPLGNERAEMPLGIVDTVYEATKTSLDRGASVSLTDGIIEAVNHEGQHYGTDRLNRSIANSSGSPKTIGDAIVADVNDFLGAESLTNDLTLLVFGRD